MISDNARIATSTVRNWSTWRLLVVAELGTRQHRDVREVVAERAAPARAASPARSPGSARDEHERVLRGAADPSVERVGDRR